jgi:alkylation response protein AidB-like acyl-CoA dehydrogenase
MTLTSLRSIEQVEEPRTDERSPAVLAHEATVAFSEFSHAPNNEAGFPRDCLSALRAAGLWSLTVPQEYGGQGAGLTVAATVIRAVARNHAQAALILTTHYACTATFHEMGWPESVLRAILRQIIVDGALLNMLCVEAEPVAPGRDDMPAALARFAAEGWLLSGRKTLAVKAEALTWAIVSACTDETPQRAGYFLVPLSAAHVSIDATRNVLGMRVAGRYDMLMQNVLVPNHHALLSSPESCARRDPTQIWLTILLMAIYAGLTEVARDWIARLLDEPSPSNPNVPLATIPRLQSELEDMEERIVMNRRLLSSIAHDHDEGITISAQDATFVKHTVTENAITVVDHALKLLSGRGVARQSPLEHYFSEVLRGGRVRGPI